MEETQAETHLFLILPPEIFTYNDNLPAGSFLGHTQLQQTDFKDTLARDFAWFLLFKSLWSSLDCMPILRTQNEVKQAHFGTPNIESNAGIDTATSNTDFVSLLQFLK